MATLLSAQTAVPSSVPCIISMASPSVTICTPTSNLTTTSPVRVAAGTTSKSAVSKIDVLVDGASYSSFAGSGIDTLVNLSTGAHKVTVRALNGAGYTFSKTVSLTIVASSGTTPAVSVAVAPQTATINAGATQQFTSSVSGSTNSAVQWTVTGAGSVSSTGLFTAPSNITQVTTATVTSTSAADTSKSASATVTINPVVSVSVSPSTATVAAGATQQFSANVSGTSNTAVTWKLSGVGTLSASGLYTAPASVASQTTATITATSSADGSKLATATVTISPTPTIAVSVSPSTATVAAGGTQQFSATVSGTSSTGVTWKLSGVGTLSASGLYTAPASVASQTTATITATSSADGSKLATATVTLTPTSTSTTSGYGNTGDPYLGGSPNSSAIPVTSCQTLSSNGAYRLTQNIGSGSGSNCLTLSGSKINLDLGGYTVTGRIVENGGDVNGTTIFNGKVTCNYADNGSDAGCILLSSSSTISSPVQLHHLTISQQSTSGSSSVRGLHVDWSASSNTLSSSTPAVKIFNVTSSVGNATGSRTPNLNVQGGSLTVEFANNDVTCPSGANACQAQVCYAAASCKMHDNRINMNQFTLAGGETGRALLFDSVRGGEAYNNLVYTNNNRAVRIRDSVNVNVHDNAFKNITGDADNYVGAVHLADPDSGTNNLNATIQKNSFEMNGGKAVWIRNGTNATVSDNTFSCVGTCNGLAGSVRAPINGGTTNITFQSNPTAASLPSAQVWIEGGASATLCKSGTASGSGSVSYTTSCQ